jgi:hypothetical protein
MAAPLSRTWYDTLVDDTGTGTTGTVWNKAAVDALMDAVDASLAQVVDRSGTPAANQIAAFGDADTVYGSPRAKIDPSYGGLLLEGALPYIDLTDQNAPAGGQWVRVTNTGSQLQAIAYDGVGNPTTMIQVSRAGVVTASRLILTGTGITFPATAQPSADPTTFDDYREGLWYPTLISTGGQSGQSYAVRDGTYTKSGRDVRCPGRLALNALGSFGAGYVLMSGLPFPAASTSAPGTIHFGAFGQLGHTVSMLSGAVVGGQTYAYIMYIPAGGGVAMNPLAPNGVTGTTDLTFTISYQAAQ